MAFLYFQRIMKQDFQTQGTNNHGVICGENKKLWMERQRMYLVPLLAARIEGTEHGHDDEEMKGSERVLHPPYIVALFNHFCQKQASVNLSCLSSEIGYMDETLKCILFAQNRRSGFDLNVQLITTIIFPSLRRYYNERGRLVVLLRWNDTDMTRV